MSDVITRANVNEMAALRNEDIDLSYPTLDRNNFASDAAYADALKKQYVDLRMEEFHYVVQNETMKAYNTARKANVSAGTRVENTTGGAWGGYGKISEAPDSCFQYVPQMVTQGSLPSSGQSCAVSANALTQKISDEMGYKGADNLIVNKSRCVRGKDGKMHCTSNNNLSSAADIHRQDSIPVKYRLDAKSKNITLNEAIKKGMINAGDEISIVTGTANGSTTSGCHAMVVVDVRRDASGKVTDYVLQGNNPPTLVGVDANKSDYYGNCKLNSAILTSKWIKDKVSNEVTTTDLARLETYVADQKSKVHDAVGRLQTTETTYVDRKNYEGAKSLAKSYGYARDYNERLVAEKSVVEALRQSVTVAAEEVKGKAKGTESPTSSTVQKTPDVSQNKNTVATDLQSQQGQPVILDDESVDKQKQLMKTIARRDEKQFNMQVDERSERGEAKTGEKNQEQKPQQSTRITIVTGKDGRKELRFTSGEDKSEAPVASKEPENDTKKYTMAKEMTIEQLMLLKQKAKQQ